MRKICKFFVSGFEGLITFVSALLMYFVLRACEEGGTYRMRIFIQELVIVFLFALGVILVYGYLNRPVKRMYYSISEDRCLMVEYKGEWYPCSYLDLPNEAYKKIYVK